MTQDELDALPEDGTFWQVEVIDGKTVVKPVFHTVGALYQGPDDALMVQDRYGDFWMTGWANGTHKRRMR